MPPPPVPPLPAPPPHCLVHPHNSAVGNCKRCKQPPLRSLSLEMAKCGAVPGVLESGLESRKRRWSRQPLRHARADRALSTDRRLGLVSGQLSAISLGISDGRGDAGTGPSQPVLSWLASFPRC